ncbi:3-hydroxybutyryl-CoA dehydrogenase [Actinomadura sp. NBRC 104412]|uniref:3-hydroxyacyl-CoA dehydrogenase n=1 Tax=Actinomadura sp. NBRC 104412 TaxID=3032203 RepID=UPI0024A577BA|nr:3-hydroxyacyl-CoA dehydrogenase [Actinomadura sp. NBRC 104412]GLZ08434.1 3-hydroxybutyryl-CoA dehydrogenase [Actinomadura sp. NBRC 104412]
MEQWTAERAGTIRVIGTGVMGRGIAQLAAAGGLTVELADLNPEAVTDAVAHIGAMYGRLVDKGRMSVVEADAARSRLRPIADPLGPADGCDLVIEAVREDLETKRELFAAVEKVCGQGTVLASNTSSLPITAIGSALEDPSRLAGLHFFNPVPLMRLVEVIPGARTAGWLTEQLMALVRRLGHEPVLAPDTPGFLVNHAGRGLVTEALQILSEGAAEPVDVDRIARDVLGLKMGPCELLDLTGLDVSHAVMESVWTGFYGEPRFRPSRIGRARVDAGLFGRKSGEGFYVYVDGVKQEPPEVTAPDAQPRPVWIHDRDPEARDALTALLSGAGVEVEDGDEPSGRAVVLVTPVGESVVDMVGFRGLPAERTLGVDPLGGFASRLTLTVHPGLSPEAGRAALAALLSTGRPVSVVRDAPATVAQRLLASIVNVGCGIAEQRLARPEDIDLAVRLGLGYPRGPLEWGDQVGAGQVFDILAGLQDATGDPRYRPSRWLAERATLGLPLTASGTAPADLVARS